MFLKSIFALLIGCSVIIAKEEFKVLNGRIEFAFYIDEDGDRIIDGDSFYLVTQKGSFPINLRKDEELAKLLIDMRHRSVTLAGPITPMTRRISLPIFMFAPLRADVYVPVPALEVHEVKYKFTGPDN